MAERRACTPEDEAEMSAAIHIAIGAYCEAAYLYGASVARQSGYTSLGNQVSVARDALTVAIADRVRGVRSGAAR